MVDVELVWQCSTESYILCGLASVRHARRVARAHVAEQKTATPQVRTTWFSFHTVTQGLLWVSLRRSMTYWFERLENAFELKLRINMPDQDLTESGPNMAIEGLTFRRINLLLASLRKEADE